MRQEFLGLPFDTLGPREALAALAARRSEAPFAYVVTPNVQHVVRVERSPALARAMGAAWLSLCDSRPLRRLGRWHGLDLPLVTGSDLTATIFKEALRPGDPVAVICASDSLAQALHAFRPDLEWECFVPPPGVEPGAASFKQCVHFVAFARARFVFVCLGAPKSEAICHRAALLPGARGTALCTGAALEFMLGLKRRAPRWVQHLGLEWLHRMLSEPRRLTGRYLGAVLPLLRIWLAAGRRGA